MAIRVEGLARKMSVDFYAASNLHANNGFQKRAECRMMLLLFNAYCYCPLILPVLLPIAIANCYCLVATAQGSRGPTNRPTDPTYRTNRPTNPTNQPDQPTRARTFTVGRNSVREKTYPRTPPVHAVICNSVRARPRPHAPARAETDDFRMDAPAFF